jgi:hypothetical protein
MKNPRLWDSPAFWEEVSSVIGWVVLEVPAYLCIFIFNFPLCLKFQIIPKMHSASLWIFFICMVVWKRRWENILFEQS